MLGKFITFEGGEGSGKSTQARLLSQRLLRSRIPTYHTREPGGTEFAEQIRSVLLDASVRYRSPLAELLLFYAARADHLDGLIRPALAKGEWVICDRFNDSTIAYQGIAGGISYSVVNELQQLVVGQTLPDLTFILDVDPHVGMKRAIRRSYGDVRGSSYLMSPEQLAFGFAPDRFEGLDIEYHRKVRDAFLAIAGRDRQRCVVIDSSAGVLQVAAKVWEVIVSRYGSTKAVPARRRVK